jgi:hypothetical protein
VYHWEENLFGGDIAGVRMGGGPPIPPFVPPELHVESWLESIAKIQALNPARIYLPHFGVVDGSIAAHLDALEERVHRYSSWFRDQVCGGATDEELIPRFATYEAEDLRNGGATDDDAADYERADPSFMAVTAALRYWRKHHPAAVGAAPS